MQRKTTPKQEFRNWAKSQGIYPSRLARDCGFTQAHAWEILNGKRKITYQTLGRLLYVYGVDGPAIPIASAMHSSGDRLLQEGKIVE